MKPEYISWQKDDIRSRCLEEYPNLWTQGESEAELRENLTNICKDVEILEVKSGGAYGRS